MWIKISVQTHNAKFIKIRQVVSENKCADWNTHGYDLIPARSFVSISQNKCTKNARN
jgi:putative component of membrane protein insertase Oxa1/YidC/SpoIIIJ protein YidD